MLAYFVNDIIERLATRQESDGWQVRVYHFDPCSKTYVNVVL
jgi:hypothetical protein